MKRCVMIQYLKESVLLSRALYSIMNELIFYKEHNGKSNFIANISYAFQDKDSFYLIQDYLEGGDLRYHMNRRVITETKARFLIACLILGLEYLHKKGLVHRNLKPENLVLDSKGFLKINDMKLLREAEKTNYFDTSGTPGYMAPEIIFRQNHGCCSDIFSLGVIAYEMMFNRLPFKSESRKEYTESLSSDKEFLIKESDLPEGWSRECATFINRCIQKRAIVRIGYNGIEELKEHRWFKDFKWEELEELKSTPPFIPKKNNHKLRLPKDYLLMNANLKQYLEYYEISKKFEGYYYNYKDKSKREGGMAGNGLKPNSSAYYDNENELDIPDVNAVVCEGLNLEQNN